MFFFKQKTRYGMRISDGSSDVCSSDLSRTLALGRGAVLRAHHPRELLEPLEHGVEDVGARRVFLVHVVVDLAARGGDRIQTLGDRSAERRVGKACVSTSRSRWSPVS